MMGHNSFQSIIRANPETGYTKISNAFLQDERISYETRGFIAELLSRPDDWEITVKNLVKSGPAGRDKIYRMIREAEKFGHMGARQDRHYDGKMLKQRYMVSDDPRLLAAALELYTLETGLEPLPENTEVVIPFPGKAEAVKNGQKQATSWKPVSGEPLPEKPFTAEPLPENPTHTNKRDLQRKEDTKADSTRAKVAASIMSGVLAVAAGPAAAQPPEPPAQVQQCPAECWQTPKARMDAGLNINELRAQKMVWMTETGLLQVAGAFREELATTFPLVDITNGLAIAAATVHINQGALMAMREIRKRFGYLQADLAAKQKRAEVYQNASKVAPNGRGKNDHLYDGLL